MTAVQKGEVMLELIMNQREYFIILSLITLVNVCGSLLEWGTFRSLLKAAHNVKDLHNHSLIKQMKQGYTNSYKLNYNVKNTNVFIEKYLYRYKVMGLPLSFIETLSEKMTLLCSVLCLGVILFQTQKDTTAIAIFYSTGIGLMAVLVQRLVNSFFSSYEKKHQFMILMQDYFDNVLENRLNNHKKDNKKALNIDGDWPPEPQNAEQNAPSEDKALKQAAVALDQTTVKSEESVLDQKVGKAKSASRHMKDKGKETASEEQIVEDIIREFFP